MRKIRAISDVPAWQLCTGCGACYSACKQNAVELIDVVSEGIRPRFLDPCTNCVECLEICPGAEVDASVMRGRGAPTRSASDVGEYLEIWEGYAADDDIRFAGSSGGLLTATRPSVSPAVDEVFGSMPEGVV